MKDFLLVFNRARSGRFVLTQIVLVCLVLLGISLYLHDHLQETLTQSNDQLSGQQGILAAKQQDLADIQSRIQQYKVLKQQGLIGAADREGWVEQLLASRKQLGLPDTLTYTLKPPLPANKVASPDEKDAPAGDATADTALAHDLELGLRDYHEEELLVLLQDFQSKAHGRFRIQACRLFEPKPEGLTIQCTLRFFSLPEEPAAPATGA